MKEQKLRFAVGIVSLLGIKKRSGRGKLEAIAGFNLEVREIVSQF